MSKEEIAAYYLSGKPVWLEEAIITGVATLPCKLMGPMMNETKLFCPFSKTTNERCITGFGEEHPTICLNQQCKGELIFNGHTSYDSKEKKGYHHTCEDCGFRAIIRQGTYPQKTLYDGRYYVEAFEEKADE